VPQSDTTYDPIGEKERAEQRRLEREIRAAKRLEATALNDTDRARAAAQVRAAQGDMRDFIRSTGRNRQSYREQLGFADGRGGRARSDFTPPAPKRPPTVRFEATKGTPVGDAARTTVTNIRSVHAIPESTSPVTVRRLVTNKAGLQGDYGTDGILRLRADGTHIEFTAAHELGHWVDNKILGGDKKFGSKIGTSDAWDAWRSAIEDTNPTIYLRNVLDHVGTDPARAKLHDHVSYLLDPREQFARSYSQWIAARTGDTVLRKQLLAYQQAENYTLRAYQWDDDEFEPIGAALDRIFKEKGLLK
jgi:hypothetical protein